MQKKMFSLENGLVIYSIKMKPSFAQNVCDFSVDIYVK